jgi:hypothetical protein
MPSRGKLFHPHPCFPRCLVKTSHASDVDVPCLTKPVVSLLLGSARLQIGCLHRWSLVRSRPGVHTKSQIATLLHFACKYLRSDKIRHDPLHYDPPSGLAQRPPPGDRRGARRPRAPRRAPPRGRLRGAQRKKDGRCTLWRRGVTSICFDVSHEAPDVTPCHTSPPMPVFRTRLGFGHYDIILQDMLIS